MAIGEEINVVRDSLYTLDKQAAYTSLRLVIIPARKEF